MRPRKGSEAFRGPNAYLFASYGVGSPAVARLTSSGALDPAFGSGGLVELTDQDVPTGPVVAGLGGGLQPDGSPVLVVRHGSSTLSGSALGAIRLNASTIALAG